MLTTRVLARVIFVKTNQCRCFRTDPQCCPVGILSFPWRGGRSSLLCRTIRKPFVDKYKERFAILKKLGFLSHGPSIELPSEPMISKILAKVSYNFTAFM